jgi:hypothetical protein
MIKRELQFNSIMTNFGPTRQWVCILAFVCALTSGSYLGAQEQSSGVQAQAAKHPPLPDTTPEESLVSDPPSMFAHPNDTWWWVSGQVNYIYQTNPPFPAEYSGPHSFRSGYNKAISKSWLILKRPTAVD